MFYVVEISTGDAKVAGKSVYQYQTRDEAVATFHSKLGAAMKSDLFETELVLVIEDNGSVERVEKYIKAAPAPDPAPEE